MSQDEQDVCKHSRNADELTYFLTALLSSVVHDNRGINEGAGSGQVLSKQAFHFVRAQTDGQVEELHWSKNGNADTLWFHLNWKLTNLHPKSIMLDFKGQPHRL